MVYFITFGSLGSYASTMKSKKYILVSQGSLDSQGNAARKSCRTASRKYGRTARWAMLDTRCAAFGMADGIYALSKSVQVLMQI